MGFVSTKNISLGGLILAHCTKYISICHILLSSLTKSQHQLSHKITMAIWRLVIVFLLMIFYICSLTLQEMWYYQSLCAALTVTCCTFQNWDPISLPGSAYPLATMATVLWETLRCCRTLHCVVRLGFIMFWPSTFAFGSAILHANNPLKNVSSEFVLVCKKAGPFHVIQATPQLVLSSLIGNFAYNVAYFSRIVSHSIAKCHVKPRSVRGHDATWPHIKRISRINLFAQGN